MWSERPFKRGHHEIGSGRGLPPLLCVRGEKDFLPSAPGRPVRCLRWALWARICGEHPHLPPQAPVVLFINHNSKDIVHIQLTETIRTKSWCHTHLEEAERQPLKREFWFDLPHLLAISRLIFQHIKHAHGPIFSLKHRHSPLLCEYLLSCQGVIKYIEIIPCDFTLMFSEYLQII